MKYQLSINQKSVVDNGWLAKGLRLNHFVVLECVADFINSGRAVTITEKSGATFTLVTYQLIVNDLPLLDVKAGRVAQIIKELQQVGLLDVYPQNSLIGKTYFRIGSEYHKYKFYNAADFAKIEPMLFAELPQKSSYVEADNKVLRQQVAEADGLKMFAEVVPSVTDFAAFICENNDAKTTIESSAKPVVKERLEELYYAILAYRPETKKTKRGWLTQAASWLNERRIDERIYKPVAVIKDAKKNQNKLTFIDENGTEYEISQAALERAEARKRQAEATK